MLTIFRRIRKGLLGNGATSKYLLYAVGEIALVVIGILIALQINNWNEERKDTTEVQNYMRQIVEELEANQKIFEDGIERARWLLELDANLLSSLQNREVVNRDTVSFYNGIRRIGRILTAATESRVYEEMIANGMLVKFRNQEIKRKIQELYSHLKGHEALFNRRNQIPVDVGLMTRSHPAIKFTLSDEALSYPEGDWDYLVVANFDMLYKDHILINRITSLMDFRTDYISAYNDNIGYCKELQEEIRKELGLL